MMARKKPKYIAEFGDFQTPDDLAVAVAFLLEKIGIKPASVIEPSCGRGSFLAAAAQQFPNAALMGLDINPRHLDIARQRMLKHPRLTLVSGSFFKHDWSAELNDLESPLLVIGNPPWVTNAELGILGSDNLPEKQNFQNMKGLDALTGKSNFDISEWMLLQNIEWLRAKGGYLAVLCKTAVARKIIASSWKKGNGFADARIYRIDALTHFGASVDACLMFVDFGRSSRFECSIFPSLEAETPVSTMGFADGALVSNIQLYHRRREIRGYNPAYTWRSGIKHDCSKVMEFEVTERGLVNGFGQKADIEDSYLYPLIKSSDIAGSRRRLNPKFVLVTQLSIGQDTRHIKDDAPRTWAYLLANKAALDGRVSIVYRNKPAFSIFGVGDYSFAPWKIAISGLYKTLTFKLYGGECSKSVMFDDTVYFLPFTNLEEAELVLSMLRSAAAQEFLNSMIFWDEKRPITIELLKRLDIEKLAVASGRDGELSALRKAACSDRTVPAQMSFLA